MSIANANPAHGPILFTRPSSPQSPVTIGALGVVMPVRNCERTIAQNIASIFAAHYYAGWPAALWIVVVAYNCTDQSSRVARDALGAFGQVLAIPGQSFLDSQRIGEAAACAHFYKKPDPLVLLTLTDQAEPVPRDWLRPRSTISDAKWEHSTPAAWRYG